MVLRESKKGFYILGVFLLSLLLASILTSCFSETVEAREVRFRGSIEGGGRGNYIYWEVRVEQVLFGQNLPNTVRVWWQRNNCAGYHGSYIKLGQKVEVYGDYRAGQSQVNLCGSSSYYIKKPGEEVPPTKLRISFVRTGRGKYKSGDKMYINWGVKNYGARQASFITQHFIYGPNGSEVARGGKSGPHSITPGKTIEVGYGGNSKYQLPSNLSPGTYTLKVKVWYNNKTISKSTTFQIAGPRCEEVKFRGTVENSGMGDESRYWEVRVGRVFFGPNLSGTVTVYYFYGSHGQVDDSIEVGDKVEVYGCYFTEEMRGVDISRSGYYIKKIRQPNESPVARFSYHPRDPKTDESVEFGASDSYDPDGNIRSYRWDFNSDGWTDANGRQVSHRFSSTGRYDVKLTVEDNRGETSSTTKTVGVGRKTKSPYASFTYSPTRPIEGKMVTFNASGSSDPAGSTRYLPRIPGTEPCKTDIAYQNTQ